LERKIRSEEEDTKEINPNIEISTSLLARRAVGRSPKEIRIPKPEEENPDAGARLGRRRADFGFVIIVASLPLRPYIPHTHPDFQ